MKGEAIKAILTTFLLSTEPLNIYQVEKKTGFSHAACHKIIQQLSRKGALKIAKVEKFRTGLETKYYTLTEKGLGEALRVINWKGVPLEEIERALDYWAEVMPEVEILWLWKVLRGGSETVKNFYISCLSTYGPFAPGLVLCVLISANEITRAEDEKEALINIALISALYDFIQRFKPEELQKIRRELLQLIKGNEQARRKVIELFEEYLKGYQEIIKDTERLLSLLKQ